VGRLLELKKILPDSNIFHPAGPVLLSSETVKIADSHHQKKNKSLSEK